MCFLNRSAIASFKRDAFETPLFLARFTNCLFNCLSIQPVKRSCVFSKALLPRFRSDGYSFGVGWSSVGVGVIEGFGVCGIFRSSSLDLVSGLMNFFLFSIGQLHPL